MSWYKDLAAPSQTWTDRFTFVVDVTGEAASTAMRAEIDLSTLQDFDYLWDVIDQHATAGDDIRITEADGHTLVSQAQITTSINKTTRQGVIRFDMTTAADNRFQVFHLYVGNTSASGAWGTVVNTTAATAYLLQDAKRGGYPVAAQYGGQAPRSTATRELVPKHPDETIFVGFLISELQPRCVPFAGFDLYEEVETLAFAVLDGDGNDQPSMYTANQLRAGACPSDPRELLVRVPVSSGTNGTDYGVELTAKTTLGREIVRRVGVAVRQTVEA